VATETRTEETGPTARARTSWSDRFQGRELAYGWSLAALCGAVAISASSGLTASRFLLPVTFMMLYAVLGYNHIQQLKVTPALRTARINVLADSLYFLGFLWTLWALIDSFVIKHFSQSEGPFRVFGYALSTTAFGMFLRLLFMQFLYTAEDQLGLGEVTVEEKLSQFAQAVQRALGAIQDFQAKTEVAATDFKTQTGNAVDTWVKSLRRAIGRLDGVLEKVDADTDGIRDALHRIHEGSEAEFRSSVESAVKALVTSLESPFQRLIHGAELVGRKVSERSDDIDASLRQFNSDVQTTSRGVEGALTDLAERVSRVRVPEDVVTSEVKARLDRLTPDLGDVPIALSNTLKKVETSLTGLSERIDKIRLPEDAIISEAATRLNHITSELEGRAGALRSTLKTVEASLSELGRRIDEVEPENILTSEVRMGLGRLISVFADLQATLKETTGCIKDLNKGVVARRGVMGRFSDLFTFHRRG